MTAAVVHPDLLLNQYSWTIEKYHQLIEHGILTEDDRVELLLGKIVDMSPIGKTHAVCVMTLNEYFIARFAGKYKFRSENPITLPNHSEPEPDFVISRITKDNYLDSHPTPKDIHVVIEVADHTLKTDRDLKAYVYAIAGIQEYWIINLLERQIERYTNPQEDGSYSTVEVYDERSSLIHALLGSIKVADLLP